MSDTLEKANDGSVKPYEIGYILLPTISEDNLAEELGKIIGVVESHGGKLHKSDLPKMTDLSYEVSKDIERDRHKFESAYFGFVTFEVDSSNISKIKEELEKNLSIIRFLLITIPNEMLVPPVMQKKVASTQTPKEDAPAPKKEEEKQEMSGEDMDKEIDALIASTEEGEKAVETK